MGELRRKTPISTGNPPLGPDDAAPFLQFVAKHKTRFEAHFRRKLREEQRRFKGAGPEVRTTTGALVALCERGGKRVRPALLHAAGLCIKASPDLTAALHAGAALELLHGYFLVHDDWMDGDTVRRGGPSAHAMLRQQFRPDHIGDAAAILSGDWGVAVATDWMAKLPLKPRLLAPAMQCFANMQLAAVTGQVRDLLAKDDRPEFTYALKTASYTVSGPLQLGAILASAGSASLLALEQYAMPLGIAFQLQDDLIGVFSPEAVTGKPFASDLKQGKRTALLLEGLKRASTKDERLLSRVLGNPNATDADLRASVRFLDESGARAKVSRRIDKLAAESLAALQSTKLRAEGKALLRSAVAALVYRGY